ncbi:MAG: hypothetical protein M3H12_14545 [Chromatiales bacterium]|nr:hypothetical protein [Gammaproteobacteria bacterium]
MIRETLYLGRNGLIDWLITAGRPAMAYDLDKAGITRAVLKIGDESIDTGTHDGFTIEAARVKISDPGKILPQDLRPDIYPAALIFYSPSYTDGYPWYDDIEIDVRNV